MPNVSTRNCAATRPTLNPPPADPELSSTVKPAVARLKQSGFEIETPIVKQPLEPVHRSPSAHLQEDWSFATQDLLDALPQRWTRGLLYLLVILAAIGLPWAMLSEVEETGNARGRLEPQGQTFPVEAVVGGKVTEVHVKEGQSVDANAVLLELSTETLQFDLQQAQAQLRGFQDRMAQLEPLKHQLHIAINTQKRQNQAQLAEQQAQLEQNKKQLIALQRLHSLEENRRGKVQKNVERYQKLVQQGVVARNELERVEAERDERDRMLGQVTADIQQAETELEKQKSAYQSLIQQGELAILQSQRQLKELDGQVTEMQSEIVRIKSQIKAQKHQMQQRVIRSPIAGQIFQLPIAKVGTVVQTDQLIAEIAPRGTALILKAQMPTPDSGSLQDGMAVKIKFDAYPFQDYGVIEGKLVRHSPTAKAEETSQGQVSSFDVEVELAQDCISTQSECIPLKPGSTATAEVIVRKRRVIDFILDPFKKLQNSGLEL